MRKGLQRALRRVIAACNNRADNKSLLSRVARRELNDLVVGYIQLPRKMMLVSVRTVIRLRTSSAVSRGLAPIWHKRMGHASPDTVIRMMNNRKYEMKRKESDTNLCREKQSKTTVTGKFVEDFENVKLHIDTWAPLPVRALLGNLYFITMTMALHRYFHVQMLKTRHEAPQSCYDHIAWIDRNGKENVSRLRSDNEKAFWGMKTVLKTIGLNLTKSSAHTPILMGFLSG